MTFAPIIPATGNVGWTFLSQTRDAQQATFNKSAIIQREAAYFRENIGNVTTAEDLAGDRRLLAVALGAFGLDEDINNTFFVQKVLQEGTLEDEAFANRLADKRYFNLAKAFSFDLTPPNTVLSTFADDIISQYEVRQFEVAVGEQDETLRLALGVERELAELAEREISETANWYTVLGTPSLRTVFESALFIPTAAAGIDIDKQLEIFRDKASSVFGVTNPTEFADPELQEELVRRFLLQQDLAASASATTSGAVALSLLQSLAPVA